MKVTAIIISYNEENIENSLKSIVKQTFPPEEVIIIDDGSNEEIKESKLEVPIPIRIIRNERNMGRGFCRNIGIIQCKSEYALFCDASNSLCYDFTEKALISFNDKKVAAVFGKITNNATYSDVYSRWRERHLFLETYPQSKESYKVYSLSTYSVLLRKSCIVTSGNFDKNLREYEDFELGKRILEKNYNILFDPKIYCYSNRKDNFFTLASRVNRWYSAENSDDRIIGMIQIIKTSFMIWFKKDIAVKDYLSALISILLPSAIIYYNLNNDY